MQGQRYAPNGAIARLDEGRVGWKRWMFGAERTGGRCGRYESLMSRGDRRTNASNEEILAYYAIEDAALKGTATNSRARPRCALSISLRLVRWHPPAAAESLLCDCGAARGR